MNPWMILAVVVAFVANGFYWDRNGHSRATVEWTAKIEKERAIASENARQQERIEQGKINDALKVQNTTLAGINSRLTTDIDKLRKRPERPTGLPETPRPACEGANGAELGGSHAIFLARFAAAAAKFDAALVACYAAIDSTVP